GQAAPATPAEETNAHLKIAVHIRNYAQVNQDVLEDAGQIATRIFRKAGVVVIAVVETEETPSEVEVTLPSVSHLYVEILPRETAARLRLPENMLGVAPGNPHEADRRRAFVFDHVADRLVRQQKEADKAEILGHAIAHEIGHVLLSMNGHSRHGLMQANWAGKDFQRMTMGGLAFASGEAGRIRAEVRHRNLAQMALNLGR
ncbi:MAG: hypothetical protein ACRD88_04085, partial [Terriglobia bacterium]